jgi:transcriptional regulator with XRE-family HTH domain
MPSIPKFSLKPLKTSQEPIGKRIARLRKKLGMTQTELAEKVGISRKLVTDYETRRVRLYDEMVIRLAFALNVSTDEILGVKDSEHEKIDMSIRFMRRMKELNKLPENKIKHILKTLDDLIRANS